MISRLATLLTAVLAALALVVLFISLPQQTQAAVWQDKVDPWVLATAASTSSAQTVSGNETEFLLYLTEQADLSGAANLQTKEEKGQYVYEQLTAVAARSQPAILRELDKLGVAYKPLWVANMVWVRGDEATLAQLARRTDVAHVYANPSVVAEQPETAPSLNNLDGVTAVEWNVTKIGAPEVWAAGFTGQGIVIGGQDTGYQWEHPAIKEQYRGWDGATADHNYSWHDAIHDADNGRCVKDSPEPCDDNSHGTHTMGTMVGDDKLGNQIGVAPDAKWIGCRNMNAGVGTPFTYAECYQWFIAPTDLNDENPDPSKAPHVINNSWSCPETEGCEDPFVDVLFTAVNAVRAAGIVTVHSAGNSGRGGIDDCGTIDTPAAIYDASFTVGNTTSTDAIAYSSSRGPALDLDGSYLLKPDVSAPGTSIRSSVPNYYGGDPNIYGVKSGTSMAGPHVAGQIALLLSARPDLIGDVDAIEALIRETAVPLTTTTETCNSVPGTQVPNNTYGWGRVDALAMMDDAMLVVNGDAPVLRFPGDLLTYTVAVSNISLSRTIHQLLVTNTLPAEVDFIIATMPYTQVGDTILWSWSALAPGETQTVEVITVVPTDTNSSPFINRYWVSIDDTVTMTSDMETAVLYIKKYVPFIAKEP